MVDNNWTVKVGDFGLSKVLDTSKEQTVCGTAGFILFYLETCAPEVLSRSLYTEKADVFSFGVVMWEIITREPLYPGLNFYELSSQVVNDGLRPNIYDFKIPHRLKSLMVLCWDEDPDIRPNCIFFLYFL
jgi:serine/threonine protein kinase